MKAHLQGSWRTVDARPECGEDFCDDCGDCLVCYWEDPCRGEDGREHMWVVYAEDEAEWLTRHREDVREAV
jgi:hypothetical protein